MKRNTIRVLIFTIAVMLLSGTVQLTAKDYILQYKIYQYDNQIGESIDWFVDNIFKPGDSLYFVSPKKSYRLVYKQDNSIQSKPEFFKTAIKKALKRDTALEGTEITTILENMKTAVNDLKGGDALQAVLERYKQNRNELINKTLFQIKMYNQFANISKKMKEGFTGFVVLQQIKQPIPGRDLYDYLSESKYKFTAMELFMVPNISGKYKKAIKKTASVMASNKMKLNLFFYKTKAHKSRDISYLDGTSELYNNYKIVCKKTGGVVKTKHTPVIFFQEWSGKSK